MNATLTNPAETPVTNTNIAGFRNKRNSREIKKAIFCFLFVGLDKKEGGSGAATLILLVILQVHIARKLKVVACQFPAFFC
ncbi:hypothetical protein [Pelobacter seleniigenes]|uniref:hypothetical protein n=1 Tax=Pelobacter seleniigenes TaxID=407188 RepID=UPI0004A71239|nr:hypothetical protein [Pelobacter seleniigenes]